MTIDEFYGKYVYTSDGNHDKWVVPTLSDGKYRDDCDGLALGILFYVLADSSWFRFWVLLIFTNTRLIHVTTSNNVGHVILKHKGLYTDTFSCGKWVDKKTMLGYGHKFNRIGLFFFWQVGVKMLISKFL